MTSAAEWLKQDENEGNACYYFVMVTDVFRLVSFVFVFLVVEVILCIRCKEKLMERIWRQDMKSSFQEADEREGSRKSEGAILQPQDI